MRSQWKILGLAGIALIVVVFIARADMERPTCWDWDEEWFHMRTTAGHIRYCVTQKHVDINQRDTEGRTLLHRLARNIGKTQVYIRSDDDTRFEATTRPQRMEMVKELLRWDTLDLDAVDHRERTALHYAARKTKGLAMASLLIHAGASLALSTGTKDKIEEQFLPFVWAAGSRLKNPFTGEVDFDEVFACETADCLLGETVRSAGPPDPDYCVGRTCQAGEGDCDPGQCAPGLTCVDDVGAQYGLPAHYDVCESS